MRESYGGFVSNLQMFSAQIHFWSISFVVNILVYSHKFAPVPNASVEKHPFINSQISNINFQSI